MDNVLELKNIRKEFTQGVVEKIHVLNGVDFSIKKGEMVALIGPSGSGKSTMLHIAGLLDSATSGEVIINGQNYAQVTDKKRTELRRRNIGFVYQFHHLLPEFDALENVAMPLLIDGAPDAYERANMLLDKMELGDRKTHRPGQLSGGQQQRVAIARALANNPAVILADEPTGNLDVQTADMVFDVMRKLIKELNLSALIATHNPDLVTKMDRVLRLQGGVIVQ